MSKLIIPVSDLPEQPWKLPPGAERGEAVRNRAGEILGYLARASHMEGPNRWIAADRFTTFDQQPRTRGLQPEAHELGSKIQQIRPLLAVALTPGPRATTISTLLLLAGQRRLHREEAKTAANGGGMPQLPTQLVWSPGVDDLLDLALVDNIFAKQMDLMDQAEASRRKIDLLIRDGMIPKAAEASFCTDFGQNPERIRNLLKINATIQNKKLRELIAASIITYSDAQKLCVARYATARLQGQLAQAIGERLERGQRIKSGDVMRLAEKIRKQKRGKVGSAAAGQLSTTVTGSQEPHLDRVIAQVDRLENVLGQTTQTISRFVSSIEAGDDSLLLIGPDARKALGETLKEANSRLVVLQRVKTIIDLLEENTPNHSASIFAAMLGVKLSKELREVIGVIADTAIEDMAEAAEEAFDELAEILEKANGSATV